MTRSRSISIDVDGEPVRLCGVRGDMTPETKAAIAELVRAAKVQFAAEHQRRRTLADDVADGLHDQPHP